MKKFAIDLKRGDFATHKGRTIVVLEDATADPNPMLANVLVMHPGNGNVGYLALGTNAELEVEVSRYNAAQEHAGALVAHLNELVVYVLAGSYEMSAAIVASAKRGRVLLDAIHPPSPVPVEELLALIADMPNQDEPMTEADHKKVANVLDRAYRSGQLKRNGGGNDHHHQT